MRMVRKAVNCDFFRLVQGGPFEERLREVNAKPILDRNIPSEDGFHRVEHIGAMGDQGERHVGLFLRLRTQTDAVVATLGNEGLSDLQLRDGEVLTEFFAFMYIPEFAVVVVHRNRDAGRQGKLERYIETCTGVAPVVLAPIIAGDAAGRLQAMNHTSKLHLVVANPENLDLEGEGGPVFQLARVASESRAKTVEVNLSVGNSNRSLSNGIIGDVLRAIGIGRENVKSALVKGRIDDEVVLVDLIKDRMQETVHVLVELNRALSRDTVFFALGQAYERRRNELRQQFREPED